MTRVRRTFKDSLFRMAFQGKEELLSLYNAINDSSYTNADDLEINTLDDVMYMGMKNDVSFLFCSYLNLYEAQSTYNPNMPLRGFLYFGDLIKGLLEMRHMDIYSAAQLKLPMPKFIVFYNGLREEPERKILRLSDSFEGRAGEEPALECTAIMLNINYGHNRELMEKCQVLHDYSYFVEEVRRGMQSGKTLEEAVDDTINNSMGEGVLKDILRKNRAEVKRVMWSDYNEELHLKNVRQMGFEEGETNKLISQVVKKVKKGQSLEQIADELEEKIETLRPIYEAVVSAAPDYDADMIYNQLKK